MPHRRTHGLVGVATGGAYAGYRAKNQTPVNQLIEIAGGCVGGWYGGPFPDELEPGTSSWHRQAAHNLAAGAGVVALRDMLSEWEALCRRMAVQLLQDFRPDRRLLRNLARSPDSAGRFELGLRMS